MQSLLNFYCFGRSTNTKPESCVSFKLRCSLATFKNHFISGDPDKRDQEEDEDVEAEDYLANLKAQQQAKRPQQQGQQQQQQFYRN